jgi:hypothetical protein
MSLLTIILQIIKYIAFSVGFVGAFFIGIFIGTGIAAGLHLFYMTFRTLRFRFKYIKKLKECKRDPSCSMSETFDWCRGVAAWKWDDAYVEDHICKPYFRKYAKWNV